MPSYTQYLRQMAVLDEWNESDHPRDDDGKFTDGAGTSHAVKHERMVDHFKNAGLIKKGPPPAGWSKVERAQTAPNGYTWYSNGKSLFSGERESYLFKDNTIQTPQDKKASVNIDFTKDNLLPKLNDDTIAELGPDADKPILVKKSILDRNQTKHPDIKPAEYNKILGETLYEPELVVPGNKEKPYYNLLSGLADSKGAVVLLEISCNKNSCEVVHLHWVKKKSRNAIIRKGEQIKQEKSD